MNSLTIKNYKSPPDDSYRVLIVDDDDQCRGLERDILVAEGFRVFDAHNAQLALAILACEQLDVILLDKNMPGVSGDELCRQIRQKSEHSLLPILIVTGSNTQIDFIDSMNAGANDFITKPFSQLERITRTRNFAYQKRLTDQLDKTDHALFALARIVESRDEGTHEHCTRLQSSVEIFGISLGLSTDEILTLKKGAILHDIGKVGIPDTILLKNGELTDAEWLEMKKHPIIGAELIKGLRSLEKVLPIIRHHHERWNGSGYPEGLAGENIPFLARVFHILDIYDALAHARPYKIAFEHEKILSCLGEEAEQDFLDPELIKSFVVLLSENPEIFCHSPQIERVEIVAGGAR